jgi:hypothetical protein
MSTPSLRRPLPNWVDSENTVGIYLRAQSCDCELTKDIGNSRFIRDPVYLYGTQIGCREYNRVNWTFGFRRCGGNRLESMPPGCTAPDFYNRTTKVAAEVKNVADPNDLVRAVLGGSYHKPKLGQQGGRYIGMPSGFRQWLFVEVRGRVVRSLSELAAFLRSRLGGYTVFERIYFITEHGMIRY